MKPVCVVCGKPAVQVYIKVADDKINAAIKLGVVIEENLVQETLCNNHRMDEKEVIKSLGEKCETIH
jgi:hypothetical protein